MKKVSCAAVAAAVVMVMVVLLGEAGVAKAVTCSPTELIPCIGAITSSQPPSRICCEKLREQRPCLCGYIKDPNLSKFVNSPNARKISATCGVPRPPC